MKIRPATNSDLDSVWEIFRHVIKTGDTYAFAPDTPKEQLPRLWFAPTMRTYVAEEQGKILGTYMIRANQIDLCSHISNCGYMVHPDARGKGLGRLLCEHSIENAKTLGFKAMQFNNVVSTNKNAVNLWKRLGFEIIGTVPKGFKHSELGYVDAYIMYRAL